MTTSGDGSSTEDESAPAAAPAKPAAGLSKRASVKLYKQWMQEIEAYERDAETWENRGDKIIRRYRDQRNMRGDVRQIRYNILWANVQVLKPALYARDPIPRVDRRFKQKDTPSRVGAQIVQNCLSYLIECSNFGDAMRAAVMDRLLPGRGTVWIRYEPTFKEVQVQTTDDEEPKTEQQLAYEKAIPDYVHWKDFGHTWARTWEEMRAVWRISYLNRAALKKRFGDEIGGAIPLTHSPTQDEDKSLPSSKKGAARDMKAPVYEIWDRETQQVVWLCKEYKDGVLDAKDDPLELEGFLPCPKPLYGTLANDDLIPTPDYVMYQDQAQELDELTERISLIVSAIRVAGVYDASAPGIARLLTEGTDNRLIPVKSWAMFAERGGLKSAIDLLPVLQIAQTLQTLYQSRDALKSDIYEITGMSDIIRGATNPNETATAQEIKSQYVNLRLNDSQKDVERFARDLLRIMADLVSSRFSIETLGNMSGIQLMTTEQKQQAMVQAQGGQAPPELQEALARPTWDEVMGVLRNDDVRNFRIEVETDSTIAINDKDEKEGINEFMMAMGQYMQGVTMAVKEGALPLQAGKAILQTIARKYRFGSEVEESFDAMDEQPQQPSAEMEQQQAEMQQQQEQVQQQQQEVEKATQELQQEQASFKTQVETERASLALDRESLNSETKIAQQELQMQMKSAKAEFDAMLKTQKAEEKLMQANMQAMLTKIQTARAEPKANGAGK